MKSRVLLPLTIHLIVFLLVDKIFVAALKVRSPDTFSFDPGHRVRFSGISHVVEAFNREFGEPCVVQFNFGSSAQMTMDDDSKSWEEFESSRLVLQQLVEGRENVGPMFSRSRYQPILVIETKSTLKQGRKNDVKRFLSPLSLQFFPIDQIQVAEDGQEFESWLSNKFVYIFGGQDRWRVEKFFQGTRDSRGARAISVHSRYKIGLDLSSNLVYKEVDRNLFDWVSIPDFQGHGQVENGNRFLGDIEYFWDFQMRSTLRKSHLRLGAFKLPLNYMPTDNPNKEILGVGYSTFKTNSRIFNFTYEFSFPPFAMKQHPNGSWAAGLGDLKARKLDGLFSMNQNLGRYGHFQFGTWEMAIELIFLTSPPPTLGFNGRAFLQPFSKTLWFSIILAGLLISLIIYANTRILQINQPERVGKCRYYPGENLSFALLSTFSPLIDQDVGLPRQMWFLSTCWMFGAVMFSNYWSEDILAAMTATEKEGAPSDFASLSRFASLKKNPYKINVISYPGSASEMFLKYSTKPDNVNIWNRSTTISQANQYDCLRKAMLEPRTVCINWDSITFMTTSRNFTIKSDSSFFIKSKSALSGMVYGVYPPNSKHYESLNAAAGQNRDTGIYLKMYLDVIRYLEKKGAQWMKSESKKRVEDQSPNTRAIYNRIMAELKGVKGAVKPLDLTLVSAPFKVLAACLFQSALAFAIEFFGRKRNQPEPKNEDSMKDDRSEGPKSSALEVTRAPSSTVLIKEETPAIVQEIP